MSLLSITFHTTSDIQNEWGNYLGTELHEMIENLMEVEKYILSEVESDLVAEGQNTNLLLIFESAEKREDFVEVEFTNISEIVKQKFGDNLLIFKTYLNPRRSRL